MPWKVRGKCVYKKDTGKKVGCTKGSVKKYLAALHINAHESKTGIKPFKQFFGENLPMGGYASNMPTMNGDQTGVEEGEYSQDTGDEISLNDSASKDQIVNDIIDDLEDLKTHDWSKPLDSDLIKAMADSLREVGIEPTDFDAAMNASPDKQEQYLITGPSSWKGGNGALNDLKSILAGNEPQPVDEEESNPAADLPMGTTSMGDWLSQENFINHKGPGRPGDSKRHGIKKHASLSSLDKIVHSKTASPRKKQLAHWQANMRRGKAKRR